MNFYNPNNRNISRKQNNSLNNWNNLMYSNTRKKRKKSNNQNDKNNSNVTAVTGDWIVAVGTIISAIGNTPSSIFTIQTLTDFRLIGNIF